MLIACLNRLSLREHANLELGIRATASRGRPSGRKAGNVGLRALYHPGPRKAAHEDGPSSSTVVGFAAHEHSVG